MADRNVILVIDNYDSFTYNLVHLVACGNSEVRVLRNDALSISDIRMMNPCGILLSPGPGRPEDAGITTNVVTELGPNIPILGVCLGHQAIGQAYGGRITHAPSLMHGKTSGILHDGDGVFAGLPNDFTATRYHSLVIDPESVPNCLSITARTSDGVIMGIKHLEADIEGVQFHPESILTTSGPALIKNWVTRVESQSVS